MVAAIVVSLLVYVWCVCIVVSNLNDIRPHDRRLTKPKWVRITMIIMAPVTALAGGAFYGYILVIQIAEGSYKALKKAISDELPLVSTSYAEASYEKDEAEHDP